jgi:hypothetical protein
MIEEKIPKPNRECGECTKCCEGWLNSNAYGYTQNRGKPCHFLLKKCTIYKDRPKDPCRDFKCVWLESDLMPMWMRPDLIKAVVLRKITNDIEYLQILESGAKLDSSVLNWFIVWAISNGKNIAYEIEGGMNKMGSEEFFKIDVNVR